MQVQMRAPRPRLRLAPHVRACHCGGQVILLDLRCNRYIGIAGDRLAALGEAVDGWPVTPVLAGVTGIGSLEELTRPLLSQGLLTDRPVHVPPVPSVDEACMPLGAEDAIDDAVAGARRVRLMLQSAIASALRLRFCSLQRIAQAVASRRVRLESPAAPLPSHDTLRGSVAAYLKLRPLVFTAQDRCLHDSLSLVGFLAHERILARWVIGVCTQPFGAHSWVQCGGIVLNDHPDHVRRYRPILVV